MLGMAALRQKETPKLLSKNERQVFVTFESTKGVSYHCSLWKHLKWKLGDKSTLEGGREPKPTKNQPPTKREGNIEEYGVSLYF